MTNNIKYGADDMSRILSMSRPAADAACREMCCADGKRGFYGDYSCLNSLLSKRLQRSQHHISCACRISTDEKVFSREKLMENSTVTVADPLHQLLLDNQSSIYFD